MREIIFSLSNRSVHHHQMIPRDFKLSLPPVRYRNPFPTETKNIKNVYGNGKGSFLHFPSSSLIFIIPAL